MKYANIQKHREQWPVAMVCELLEVSSSDHHNFVERSKRDDEIRLVLEMCAQHARSQLKAAHRTFSLDVRQPKS